MRTGIYLFKKRKLKCSQDMVLYDLKLCYILRYGFTNVRDVMLIGVVVSGSRHTVLPEQIIALEKAGCQRFHIVDRVDDLDNLRRTLAPTDLLIKADVRQGVSEVPAH